MKSHSSVCILNVALALFLVWSCTVNLQGQNLKGRVISQQDKSPLGFANVFLNNTKIGTKTDEEGFFELKTVEAGAYELIVSYIGYEVFTNNVTLSGSTQTLLIELVPKSILLEEIVVEEDKNWKYNYISFLDCFVGKTENAKECVILNPDILYLKYDYDSLILKAHTDEFLVIENKALGYRIKYLLIDFRLESKNKYFYILGYTFFEEMKGSARKQKQWEKARERAYLGSKSHFLHCLIEKDTEEAGFELYKMRRIPNPDRLPEDSIKQAIKNLRFSGNLTTSDTLRFWMEESSKPQFVDVLDTNKITQETLISQKEGYQILQFDDYLYVIYTKAKESPLYLQQFQRFSASTRKPSWQTSMIILTSEMAVFDQNAVLLNPLAIINEGYWAWSEKVAEMLPLEYRLP